MTKSQNSRHVRHKSYECDWTGWHGADVQGRENLDKEIERCGYIGVYFYLKGRVASIAARLASTLVMAGEVVSTLCDTECSLTAESIKVWAWYLEVVTCVVGVVASKRMRSFQLNISVTGKKVSCSSNVREEASDVRGIFFLDFWGRAVLLSEHRTLNA